MCYTKYMDALIVDGLAHIYFIKKTLGKLIILVHAAHFLPNKKTIII